MNKRYFQDRDGYGGRGRGSSRTRSYMQERRHLVNTRVIQRDLVYIIGIPNELASEQILSRYEYFGHFGKIKKIIFNSQGSQQRSTVGAYVTFCNQDDALECIYAMEKFVFNGVLMKASFGTSKYCSNFLSGLECTNPDCMYLHKEGNPKDSFNTDEISYNSDRFSALTNPVRPPDYDSYLLDTSKETVFPPRRILSKKKPELVRKPAKTVKISKTRPFYLPELVVSYTTAESLTELLRLNQIRMITGNKRK